MNDPFSGDGTGRAETGPRPSQAPGLDEAEIVRFLEARPDFLVRHPSLYLTLTPPARVHGEAIADHMAAMLAALRRHNRELHDHVERRRAGRSARERVEQALIGLVRAADPLEWVSGELALTLNLDAAHLCFETNVWGGRKLPPGTARQLLCGRDVVFRTDPPESAMLHGAAAALVRSDALVRIPLASGQSGVLALASRDPATLADGHEGPLALLGHALAAAVERA